MKSNEPCIFLASSDWKLLQFLYHCFWQIKDEIESFIAEIVMNVSAFMISNAYSSNYLAGINQHFTACQVILFISSSFNSKTGYRCCMVGMQGVGSPTG